MRTFVWALAVAGVVLAGCSGEPTQLSAAECVAVIEQRSAAPAADGRDQVDLAELGCEDVPVVAAPSTTTPTPTTTTPPVTTTTAPVTTTTAAPSTVEPAPVVEPEPEPEPEAEPEPEPVPEPEPDVVAATMTDAECDEFALSSSLSNAELYPLMRDIGCGERLDELEAIATEQAQIPEEPATADDWMTCPEGQVFSGLGGGCMSQEEADQILELEALCGGGEGPVDVCGPSPYNGGE